MKKVFKIFIWIIGIVLLLIVVLTVVAKLSENKISDIALKKVSESIKAPVTIGNVSFNLLRKFPLATIELNDVCLGSPKDSTLNDSITTTSDTIIYFNKIYVSVKSKPLMDGIVEIMKVDVHGANIFYKVDTSGATNIDFLMGETDTTAIVEDTTPSAPLNITLTDLSLKNIQVYFADQSLKTKAKVAIPEIKVKAKIDGDNISASVIGGIALSNCSFEETNLYLMKKTNIDFDVDYFGDSVSIKNLAIVTDGAELNLAGSVVLGDEIETHIKFEGKEVILDELMKYAPKELLKEFGVNKVTGKLNLSAAVNGKYSETEMPKVDAIINFTNGNVATVDYPELKNISFSGKVSNGFLRNNQTTQADFSSFHFETKQSKFDVAFSVLDIDHPKYDVKTDMSIVVEEFSKFIPDSTVESIRGKIKFNMHTKGVLPDSIGDDFTDYVLANTILSVGLSNFNIKVDSSLSVKNLSAQMAYKPNNFSLKNFNIQIPEYGAKLKNTGFDVGFKGSINNTAGMSLNIRNYHIETDSSTISGSATVKNLDHPTYSITTNVDLNLGEFFPMVPDTLLTALSGKILATLTSKGTLDLDSIADQATNIVFNSSSFIFEFKDIEVEMPNDPMSKVEKFSGVFEMDKSGIRINDMVGRVAGIDFAIDSTTLDNVYQTIIQESRDTQIVLQTNLHLGTINYNLLAAMMESDSTLVNDSIITDTTAVEPAVAEQTDSVPAPLLPNFEELGIPHFLVRGKFSVDKIIYEKNIIDDISGKFRFADSLYVIDEFKLTTCGGDLISSMMLDAREWEKPKVDIKNIITGLDLNELLVVNDDFDQTDMTHKNLSGILTSELHARAFYVDGDWDDDQILVKGHFTLENGKIYDFKPLVDASVGIGGLKELDKMDFNTLKTSIFLFRNKVYVPKTDVVSNALDLTVFAMHGMDSTLGYEYHLVLHLGDVVKGKSDKLMEKQAKQNKKDGGTVDRSGLNLVSMNIDGKNKNGFDNEKLKNKFMKGLSRQHSFLNLLFDPRLVNFSTDLDRSTFIKSQQSNK
ncbi:MAG: AsmA family protein [Salinivirgaceae bacterium]|nr:AsmA family protein [Salinivirgaceae bacterium]